MSKPILFSGPMVRAILENRKHQTRRVITAVNSTVCGYSVTKKDWSWRGLVWNNEVYQDEGPHILHPSRSQYLHVPFVNPEDSHGTRVFRVRSRVEIGDELWVKETWATEKRIDQLPPSELGLAASIPLWFKADEEQNSYLERGRWRSSMFMPRWASRLTLEITNVRAERVGDISEADAKDEGFNSREEFFAYWDTLNAKRGYGRINNPWCWVRDFEVKL